MAKPVRPHQTKGNSQKKDSFTGKNRPSTPKRREGGLSFRLSIDLYGIHAVREAILNPARDIKALYATEDMAPQMDQWVTAAHRTGLRRPDIQMPERAAFDAALARDSVHQGVGLACAPLPDMDLDDLLRGFSLKDPALIVILDQVTDPHNMGAIIRSACAFGAAAVVVQRRHAPDLNALIAKTACGAVEHIPVIYETNLSRSIEALKEAEFTIYGLDERGDIKLPDISPPLRSAIVLGAEGPGMRRLIREHCDQLVRLPTCAPIASLNVSNAAAVTLYHFSCFISEK